MSNTIRKSSISSTKLHELDIQAGDVKALDFPSSSVGCYLSLGVVEHFVEGPETALAEAGRVLRPDGVALISVPYLNRARQLYLYHISSVEKEIREELSFYQYYFSNQEFTSLLKAAGLKVIDCQPLFIESHLLREHPQFLRYWGSRFCRHRMKKPIRKMLGKAPFWARERYGHMMMYVCKKVRPRSSTFRTC